MDKAPSRVNGATYLHRYGGWRKALKAFVERANSDTDSDPARGLDQDLPNLADRTGPTGSSTTSAASPGTARSDGQVTGRRRVPGPAQRTSLPVDRREPGYRLRYKVLMRDRSRCQLCGRSPATDLGCNLQLDHIVPFSRGGKTTFENLRILCAPCNLGKSNG